MNFFEMIYHSGPDEFECDFYKNNSIQSRSLLTRDEMIVIDRKISQLKERTKAIRSLLSD